MRGKRSHLRSGGPALETLMEDMDFDENSPPVPQKDPEAAVLENGPASLAHKKKSARKAGPRKIIPELDVEATEKNVVNEKLEYFLSEYEPLLEKACKSEKGQKALIKRLWTDHDEVVERCSVNSLRHALWEPSFLNCTEGVKFCAYALRKIGFRSAFLLMKKMVVGGASSSTCNHLGQVIYTAWRMAVKEENEDMMKQIETEMITGTIHDAILLPFNLSSKFIHKREECLYKQNNIMLSMLKDDCTAIRMVAAKKVLKILSMYWNFIPRDFVKQYMTIAFAPRASGNDANSMLAKSRCIYSALGLRAAYFFDVVPMEEVLARLQVETSESVRREIVPLIFKSFFPDRDKADQSEKMRRIAFLIKHGRICALTFHRLIFPLGLVTVKEAVEHILFMTIVVYRSFSKGMSADATMDGSLRIDDSIATLSGPSQDIPMPDEDNQVWKRNQVFLECVVVMWMSMRKALMETKHTAEKQKLDNLETKVFKKLFQCFRNTSLIGTTMLIGSMLPPSSMDSITQSVLSLLNEKVVDECVMEPYLEATAQWRIEHLFEIINSAVHRTSQNVANLLAILRDRVESVAKKNPPEDNMILYQLREMFE
ncbi:hypothetical protein TELCIR_03780 [Teladorsagia circumcincta]|uniref:Uncharacterized protein n=1 Tax=Teladorsagia circumcincta TaxID=45464 RepID=A0A2G9UVD1_TELCI|nr:hypothetical protein TELCIR_03780 [Teladorsagia circumcincta]